MEGRLVNAPACFCPITFLYSVNRRCARNDGEGGGDVIPTLVGTGRGADIHDIHVSCAGDPQTSSHLTTETTS